MPGISAPNNTDPREPKHLNMIEMAAPSYIIRIMQMNLIHLIIERIPEDFPPFIGKANFDSVKFLKWNNLIHPERD